MIATVPRSPRLEAVRAVAALAVVACHAYAFTNSFAIDAFAKRVVLGGGVFGVYTFFALSGYLLYLPFARRDLAGGPAVDLRRYARNRAFRILPLYYVVLITVLVVDGASTQVALRFLTFTQNFDEALVAKAVDGPMWSLVVELHFYALLPMLAAGVRAAARGSARRTATTLAALGAVAAAVAAADLAPHDVWTYNLPSTFQYFVPGMLVAVVHARAEVVRPAWMRSPFARADLWIAGSVLPWLVVFWDLDLAPLATLGTFLFIGAAALPIRHGGLDRFLAWPWLAKVGLVSYGVYLWHVPVLDWVQRGWMRGVDGAVALGVAGVLVTLAVATATWVLVEAPAMQLRRRRVPATAWPFVGVAGVAAAVRVTAASATWPPVLGADGSDYDRLGRLLALDGTFGESLLAAGGGPTAFRPPGYPAFLAAVFRATGGSAAAARAAQLVLGVAVVLLVAALAHQLWGRRVGIVAGLLAACYPPLVAASLAPMSESLFLPLVLGALVCGLEAGRRTRPLPWAAAAGLLCGLGALTRPAGLVLVPVVALLACPGRARAAAAGVALLAVVPWSVHASIELGTVVPVSTIDGFNLAGVYSEEVADDPALPGVWRPPVALAEHAPLFDDTSLGEGDLSARLRGAGTDFAVAHPSYVVEVAARSTLRLLDAEGPGLTEVVYRDDYGFAERSVARSAFASWWLVAPFALAGLGIGAWRGVPRPLLAAPVLLWAVTVPVLGHARLRAPLEPFVVLLAAYASAELLGRLAAARSRSTAASRL